MTGVSVNQGDIVSIKAADGCRLKGRLWRTRGEGPLLVALHGVMSHALWFHQLADALVALDISLLAVDRRGAGMNREAADERSDERDLIQDLDAWLDYASTLNDAIHLVGFCWGANHALHYLGGKAAPVASLILMAPGVAPASKIAIRRHVGDMLPDERARIPLALDDFTRGPALEGFLRPDPLRLTHVSAAFIDMQNRIGRWSAVRLARLRLPLLTILAAEDEISDNARTRDLFARSPAEPKALIELPGRHGVIFDAPKKTASACKRWLDHVARH